MDSCPIACIQSKLGQQIRGARVMPTFHGLLSAHILNESQDLLKIIADLVGGIVDAMDVVSMAKYI